MLIRELICEASMDELAQVRDAIDQLTRASIGWDRDDMTVDIKFEADGMLGTARLKFKGHGNHTATNENFVKRLWAAARSTLRGKPKNYDDVRQILRRKEIGPKAIKILTNRDFFEIISADWAGINID